jgi:transposase
MTQPGRPVTIRIKLTREQRKELREFARQAVGRVSERAHFVLLSDKGKSVPEIAEWMDYSAETVYSWLERYRAEGIAGLEDDPRSGRPPNTPHLRDIVEAQADQSPECSGHVASCWTVGSLVAHLWQRFRVRVSGSALRRVLHSLGYVCGRPKLAMAKRTDPDAEAKLARLNAVLAELDATLIAEDECEMHLCPILRRMWHRRGRQPRIPTPGQNRRCPIFGGVDLRTGEWHYHLSPRKRSVDFIAFLEQLLPAYPTGPIYVILDNVSIHLSRAVRSWLAEHPRLQLVFLPTYAGHALNPVEKVWWLLKHKVAANRCFKNLAALVQFIQRHFDTLSTASVMRLINSPIARQAQLPA